MARSNCRQRFRMSVSVPKRRPSIFGEWYTCINKEGKVRNHLKLLENLKRFIRGRNHDEPMAYYSSIETCNSDATSFFSPSKEALFTTQLFAVKTVMRRSVIHSVNK